MDYFLCPDFGVDVECTNERFAHFAERYGELASSHSNRVAETIREPEQVWSSSHPGNAILFFRWYDDLAKNVLAVINSDENNRRWLVTAYVTRTIRGGELQWALK